jgi:hypothetical protein
MTIEWSQPELLAFRRGETYFQAALICRRGHVLDSSLSPQELDYLRQQKCSTCGATCLKACPKCNFRIKGRLYVPQVVSFRDFEPHSFVTIVVAHFHGQANKIVSGNYKISLMKRS